MAIVLLCEVELGEAHSTGWGVALPPTITRLGSCASVYHEGQTKHHLWQDAEYVHPDLKGILIPNVGRGWVTGSGSLQHDEYVIFDPAQIRQR